MGNRKLILFVCYGNSCRSPMAEALCRNAVERAGLAGRFLCQSAGLAISPASTANPKAVTVMAELGIDISEHWTRCFTDKLVSESELIYVMDESQQKEIADFFYPAPEQVCILGKGVKDPYGQDLDGYRACRDLIREYIKEVVEELQGLTENDDRP